MFILEWFRKEKWVKPKYDRCEVCLLKATHMIVKTKELRTIDNEFVSQTPQKENKYCSHCWQDKYEE